MSLAREEVQAWRILFSIYHHYILPSPSAILRLLKYQISENFCGILEKVDYVVNLFGHDRDFKKKARLISDLQIFNSLNVI